MRSTATLKDVLYALEYTGAELVRRRTNFGLGKPAWSLEPAGPPVPQQIADKALLHPSVVLAPARKYGESRYVWQRAAA